MSTRYLPDTNVLAREEKPSAALLAQVLAEFANVILRGLDEPLAPREVHRQIERYEDLFPILPLTSAVVLETTRGIRGHSFSYFDA